MNQMLHGDCLIELKNIEKESIDLILTSPPYDNLRTYNNSLNWNFNVFSLIAVELARVLKKQGAIVWVVGDSTINGSESCSSFRQALFFKEKCNLNLHDTMIYAKNNVIPLTHNRYEQSFEYMFVFSKGKPKTFNPIEDKLNKYSGTAVHGTQYLKDNSKRISGHNKKTIKRFGRRHNIFFYNNPGNKKIKHPAVFPEQLAIDHIITWSNKNDIVLDPFMGSGTTGIACKKTQRFFIGIEKEKEYFELACRRINDTQQYD